MVKLKLARIGRAHQPHYRIVAVEENTKASGKYIENIGYYIPTDEPKTLKIDKALYDAWIKKGAIPTDTVARLAQGPLAAKKKAKRNKHHEEAMAKKAAAVPAPATAPAPVAEAPKAEAAVTESAPAEKPAEKSAEPAKEALKVEETKVEAPKAEPAAK